MQVQCTEITNESWWCTLVVCSELLRSSLTANLTLTFVLLWQSVECMNCIGKPAWKITCSVQIIMETMITCAVCWLDHSKIAYQVVISRVSLLVTLITRYSCNYWCNFLIYLYFSEFHWHLFTVCHMLLLHILWNFLFWTSALYLFYVILLRSTSLMQFL